MGLSAMWEMRRIMKNVMERVCRYCETSWKSGRVRSGNVRMKSVFQPTIPRKASGSFQNWKMRGMTLGFDSLCSSAFRRGRILG